MQDFFSEMPTYEPSKEDIKIFEKPIPKQMINTTIRQMKQYGYPTDKEDPYILIIGSVSKIDELWKQTDLYIDGKITKKLVNSKRDILNGKVEEPPIIGFDTSDQLTFQNGRHRFANLRDSGVKSMPILIYKEDKDKFIEKGLVKPNYLLALGSLSKTRRQRNSLSRSRSKFRSSQRLY